MHLSKRLLVCALVLGSLGSATACGGAELPPAFPLAWAGVESKPALTDRGRAATSGKSFHFERIVDRRADPTSIGTESESQYVFRTTSDVGAFASERFKQLVGDAGLNLTDTGDFIVQGELRDYKVTEGNSFDAEVQLMVRVFKPGTPAFEQVYSGKGSTFGRSHSPDNINEALSKAMLTAVSLFLHDDLFADFLEGKGAKAPAAAPSASASTPAPAAPAPSASGKSKPRTL